MSLVVRDAGLSRESHFRVALRRIQSRFRHDSQGRRCSWRTVSCRGGTRFGRGCTGHVDVSLEWQPIPGTNRRHCTSAQSASHLPDSLNPEKPRSADVQVEIVLASAGLSVPNPAVKRHTLASQVATPSVGLSVSCRPCGHWHSPMTAGFAHHAQRRFVLVAEQIGTTIAAVMNHSVAELIDSSIRVSANIRDVQPTLCFWTRPDAEMPASSRVR